MSDSPHKKEPERIAVLPPDFDMGDVDSLSVASRYAGAEGLRDIVSGQGLLPKELPPLLNDDFALFERGLFPNGRPTPAVQKAQALDLGARLNRDYREAGLPGKRVKSKLPRKSLEWLAGKLHKSARHIRRYCEAGIVPGAYRTKGGHWRVRSGARTVAAVRKGIVAFERGAWTDGERRSLRRRDGAESLLEDVKVAHEVGRVLQAEPTQAMAAARQKQVNLFLAAKNLHAAGRRVNAVSIARVMGFSRPTLYRRFSAAEISAAQRAALEPASLPPGADADKTENSEEAGEGSQWDSVAQHHLTR